MPNVLVAMNEPSLRKFYESVRPGGWILYNGESFPEDCVRADVHVLARHFTQLPMSWAIARASNMVMLGALLETPMYCRRPVLTRLCDTW